MKSPTLPAAIAWRYLRAPKSHSAVSAISIVSMAGVAVATAAIICVLSVFNGFRGLLGDKLDILAPDLTVTPAHGKTFADADSLVALLDAVPGVAIATPTLTDNALAIAGDREMPVSLKGVRPADYARLTAIDSITMGDQPFAELTPDRVVASVGVASRLGLYARDMPLFVFAPKRVGRLNPANPAASFVTDSVAAADIFQAMQSDYDEKLVLCDLSLAQNLMQRPGECSAVEVALDPEADPAKVAALIADAAGPGATVTDRERSHASEFRMVQVEKWVTFLMLIFILVIASFNIVSTMCMLVLEKEDSMSTLRALGMTPGDVGRVFGWESLYVSVGGGLAGVALGVVLCLIQQHFGLIKLAGDPANLVMASYPVVVEWGDILVSLAPVAAIGAATALTASLFARSRARK